MALYLRYAVRSDLGLVRTNNEDSVYAGPRLLAIADGMGGHAAGEVASKIVIGTLEPLDEDRRIDDLMGDLRRAVADANRGIAEAVQQRRELEGMGTTLTALRFVGSQIGLVHVGDSRAYLLRNDALSQITHDDTYVQYLVDSGKLTPEEAKDHPRRSVILRALLGTEVEPDVSIREAQHGDRYMLCSDGLSDVVSTETILETMRIEDTQEAADRLVELALRGGGPDNVTVIVADVLNAKVGDHINDVPVIAGAFVDPAAAEVPGADSAAERAASLGRPAATAVAEPPPKRRTWRWRPWLILIGVVVVLAAALGGFYAWTQTQYFVGRNGNDVAIFQGVNTEIGPLKFFSVDEDEGSLKYSQLSMANQRKVSDGITADDKTAARKIIARLEASVLRSQVPPVTTGKSPVPCPSTSPTPTPSASASNPLIPPSSHTPSRSGSRTPVRHTASAKKGPSAKRHTKTITPAGEPVVITPVPKSSTSPATPSPSRSC